MLELHAVSKRFGGHRAVDGVSFRVARGTVTGPDRPERRRQDHPVQPDRRRPAAVRRAGSRLDGERLDGLPPTASSAAASAAPSRSRGRSRAMTVLENVMLAPLGQRGERFWCELARPAGGGGARSGARARPREHWLAFVGLDRLAGEPAARPFRRAAQAPGAGARADGRAAPDPARRAGGRRQPGAARSDRSSASRANRHGITFLIIEHNMDLVIDLCRPVLVMAQGRLLLEGDARGRSRRPARRRRLSRRGAGMSAARCCAVTVVAGYEPGLPIVHGASLSVAPARSWRCSARTAPASRRCQGDRRPGPARVGPVLAGGDGDHRACRPTAWSHAGLAFVPQTENVFATLSVRGQSRACRLPARTAERRARSGRSLRALSRPGRQRRPPRRAAVGRAAPDAGGGAGALVGPRVLDAGRAIRGTFAEACRRGFREARRSARAGVAILMVEQNVKAALAIADRAVVLVEGRIRLDGRGGRPRATDPRCRRALSRARARRLMAAARRRRADHRLHRSALGAIGADPDLLDPALRQLRPWRADHLGRLFRLTACSAPSPHAGRRRTGPVRAVLVRLAACARAGLSRRSPAALALLLDAAAVPPPAPARRRDHAGHRQLRRRRSRCAISSSFLYGADARLLQPRDPDRHPLLPRDVLAVARPGPARRPRRSPARRARASTSFSPAPRSAGPCGRCARTPAARVTGIDVDGVIALDLAHRRRRLPPSPASSSGLTVQLRPQMGFDLLLPLFAAAILGGIGSVHGAVLGGLIVGLAESSLRAADRRGIPRRRRLPGPHRDPARPAHRPLRREALMLDLAGLPRPFFLVFALDLRPVCLGLNLQWGFDRAVQRRRRRLRRGRRLYLGDPDRRPTIPASSAASGLPVAVGWLGAMVAAGACRARRRRRHPSPAPRLPGHHHLRHRRHHPARGAERPAG